MRFSLEIYTICAIVDAPIYFSTLVEELVIVTHKYRVCAIVFMNLKRGLICS